MINMISIYLQFMIRSVLLFKYLLVIETFVVCIYVAGKYFKSGIFHEHFIFANIVKRHICDAKNSRLGHDLPISVYD